jgi:hypothetical protein
MIPPAVHRFLSKEIGAPSIITSDSQLEIYVATLLDLDRRHRLSLEEENFAELLSILIENYVEKHDAGRLTSRSPQ